MTKDPAMPLLIPPWQFTLEFTSDWLSVSIQWKAFVSHFTSNPEEFIP